MYIYVLWCIHNIQQLLNAVGDNTTILWKHTVHSTHAHEQEKEYIRVTTKFEQQRTTHMTKNTNNNNNNNHGVDDDKEKQEAEAKQWQEQQGIIKHLYYIFFLFCFVLFNRNLQARELNTADKSEKKTC